MQKYGVGITFYLVYLSSSAWVALCFLKSSNRQNFHYSSANFALGLDIVDSILGTEHKKWGLSFLTLFIAYMRDNNGLLLSTSKILPFVSCCIMQNKWGIVSVKILNFKSSLDSITLDIKESVWKELLAKKHWKKHSWGCVQFFQYPLSYACE